MKPLVPTHAAARIGGLSFAILGLFTTLAVHAESPMRTDDASTLGQGAMKVEGVLSRAGKARGGELQWGAGVLPQLEVGLAFAAIRDRSVQPATQLQARRWGLKWVPLQNDLGWSVGARLDAGELRVHDRVLAQRYTDREYALTGLASYRFAGAQALHLNAGRRSVKSQGMRSSAATWAAGYELPVAERLQLTTEVYGEQHARPEKAAGLRYQLAEGLKVSAAVGRGNGRTFSQLGMAWEF
jgi:hypothetical protein